MPIGPCTSSKGSSTIISTTESETNDEPDNSGLIGIALFVAATIAAVGIFTSRWKY